MKTIEYNLILFISQIMKLFYLYFVMGQIVVEYLKPLAVENNFAFFKTFYCCMPQVTLGEITPEAPVATCVCL